jgi:hypothetical protein
MPREARKNCPSDGRRHFVEFSAKRFSMGATMLRFAAALVVCLFLGAGGGIASAKQCRDAHGKFIKCPAATTAMKKTCRDAKGKFIKCSSMKKRP